MDAYDGFEEQPVRDLSRFIIESADAECPLKDVFHLRFTLFRDEGLHHIDIAGVQCSTRRGYDGSIQ